jgi:hypothetical protein
MIEWWSEQSPWVRYGVAGGLLLASTLVWLAGRFWPWGWVAGAILLVFSGPSDSEEKGYHF